MPKPVDTGPIVETFGTRLRRWADTFRTYGDCARAIGTDQSTLTKYMKDEQEPKASLLARIEEAGGSVRWMLTGKGDMLVASESAGSGDFRLVDIRDTETVMEMLTEYMARQKAKERDE